ncbi:hypothetical protein MAR_013256 [Mya arenaria]|uniref:Ig-like domain-containing protein n=1 Tax=Mya arenaria TaxID=6604 RepID=A0ABY7G2L9_MYAAR|nr:hypothetical protein MAR_013256 [Mya arenaria]
MQSRDSDLELVYTGMLEARRPNREEMASKSRAARHYDIIWENLSLVDVTTAYTISGNGTGTDGASVPRVGITSTVISSPIVNPVSVIANTTGTFQCETSPGNPVATVVWYKENTTSTTGNYTQITSGTNTSSTPDGDLIVTHGTLTLQVQRDDQDLGVYCRARNKEQWFTSGTKKINILCALRT